MNRFGNIHENKANTVFECFEIFLTMLTPVCDKMNNFLKNNR